LQVETIPLGLLVKIYKSSETWWPRDDGEKAYNRSLNTGNSGPRARLAPDLPSINPRFCGVGAFNSNGLKGPGIHITDI
jgi:hypothetical protein